MKKNVWIVVIAMMLLLPAFQVTVNAEEVVPVIWEYEDFSQALQIDTNAKIQVLVPKLDEEGAPVLETFENYFKIVLPEDAPRWFKQEE